MSLFETRTASPSIAPRTDELEVGADPAALCEEILAEGRRRAEALREDGRAQAEAILAKARLEAEALRGRAMEDARLEAARRTERLRAGVGIESGRMRAARAEALLDSLRERARRELLRGLDATDAREAVAALASQALARMAGEGFVLRVGAGAGARDGLAAEILRRAGRGTAILEVTEDATIPAGGFVLRDAEGRQLWNGRLAVRLDRLWPALRVPVAAGAGLLEGADPEPGISSGSGSFPDQGAHRG